MKLQIEKLLWEDFTKRKHPDEVNGGEKNRQTEHPRLPKMGTLANKLHWRHEH